MGANADTGSLAEDCLTVSSIGLALEAASLQWMEAEKELSVRTPRSKTLLTTCMELPGLPLARDNSSGGVRLIIRKDNCSDEVACSGIDREVPIYRPIPHIVEGALQKVA